MSQQTNACRRRLTWKPLVPVWIVRSNGCLAVLEHFNSMWTRHDDGQAWWDAQTLLWSRNNNIQVPLVKANLFWSNRAHAIHNHQRLGRSGLYDLSNTLDVWQDTRPIQKSWGPMVISRQLLSNVRGVDMGHSDHLVLLLRNSLLDFFIWRTVAERSAQVGDLGAICFQATYIQLVSSSSLTAFSCPKNTYHSAKWSPK